MFLSLKQIIDQRILKPRERYRLLASHEGHRGPVNCLAFNSNATLLISGGDDEEVHVWDVVESRRRQTLVDQSGRWGQICYAMFIYPEAGPLGVEWLAFGTGRGLFLVYRRNRKDSEFIQVSSTRTFTPGDSVECFAFDQHHDRLVVTSHYGKILMYRFDNGNLVELWAEEMSDAIPRSVTFAEKGNNLLIYGMETGAIMCRDPETSTEKYTRVLPSCIGNVGICPLTGAALIDNLSNGFELYPATRTSPIRHFQVQTTKKYVKKGAFGERGKVVICGSDHGIAYVFAANGSQPLQTLKHGRQTEMIQIIDAASTNDNHLIATGSSGGKFDVRIWQKPIREAPSRNSDRHGLDILMSINILIFLLFVWMTSETWMPPLTENVISIFNRATQNIVTHTGHFAFSHSVQKRPPLDVQNMLELDEATLRKLLGMQAKLNEEDLRGEETKNLEQLD